MAVRHILASACPVADQGIGLAVMHVTVCLTKAAPMLADHGAQFEAVAGCARDWNNTGMPRGPPSRSFGLRLPVDHSGAGVCRRWASIHPTGRGSVTSADPFFSRDMRDFRPERDSLNSTDNRRTIRRGLRRPCAVLSGVRFPPGLAAASGWSPRTSAYSSRMAGLIHASIKPACTHGPRVDGAAFCAAPVIVGVSGNGTEI